MHPLVTDALLICEGFGSSRFRTSGGEEASGLLDDEQNPIDPYGTPGQTALQRVREFRVATHRVTAFGIAKQDSLWVRNVLTGDEEEFKVGDMRREGDGAITALFLKAVA